VKRVVAVLGIETDFDVIVCILPLPRECFLSAAGVGAGVGATKEGKMAPNFSSATPDRALRFSIISAVNRRVASSNLARGAKLLWLQSITALGRAFGYGPNAGGPYEHANFHMSYKGPFVVQFCVCDS
jgi:hypothetical protein